MAAETQDGALLAFFLGPVQPFIASARTLRDLWTGSYLLSWLTVAAMEPLLRLMEKQQAEMITPHVTLRHPMVAAYLGGGRGDPRSAVPGFPSRFRARVPADGCDKLAEKCVDACRREWEAICGAVRNHKELAPVFAERADRVARGEVWDKNWPGQITSYFEQRCVAIPLGKDTDERIEKLNVEAGLRPEARRMALLERLMDAAKSVRHVPAYVPQGDAEGRFPAKCSLLGNFEQMGPAEFHASREFWASLTSRKEQPNWNGLRGTRLQKSDRLCAVSLVKRFAWPAYFGGKNGRLGLELKKLRFSDTATVAARRWLAAVPALDPDAIREEHDDWSGQWLHWAKLNQEPDEKPCPPEIWERIREKKRLQGPPSYYAVLVMDGDQMGYLFQGKRGSEEKWGRGFDRFRAISEKVGAFALESARQIVEDHHAGEVIYAGGDDLLALLPTETLIDCAGELHEKFASPERLGKDDGLIKAGAAVVHHKEDLRFALHMARRAEEVAKNAGRNALALTVCRRSGEHTTAVMGWDQAEPFSRLVSFFRGPVGVSDRWAYRLREELPTLGGVGIPWEARAAEVSRALRRVEGAPEGFRQHVETFLGKYRDEMNRRIPTEDRNDEGKVGRVLSRAFGDFITLCQSASFLARGRD
jgi:CRISPR-associated protein Cmr2